MQALDSEQIGVATDIVVPLIVNLASAVIAAVAAALLLRLKNQVKTVRFRAILAPLIVFSILWIAGSIAAFLVGYQLQSKTYAILLLLVVAVPCSLGLGLPTLRFWQVGVGAVDKKMKSGLTPAESLKSINSGFKFLGTGASKLTSQEPDFTDAVTRCNSSGATVQLLLSKPDAENLALAAIRVGKPQNEYKDGVVRSLRRIAELKRDRAADIEVRFYEGLTIFRVMLINDRTCVFSYNVYGTRDEQNFPQLLLTRKSADEVQSFYWGFKMYFDQLWEKSEPWNFQDFLD